MEVAAIINVVAFYKLLKNNGINFYTGVPDSLLQAFCACVSDREPAGRHICAANEGNAAAIATGHYLATGDPALVYMQNSGLGNVVNPATSLLDPLVYSIPVLFLIGWRGEPGIKDEPQHIKQGQITTDLLQTLGIRHAILPRTMEEAQPLLEDALAYMKREKAPFALVVSKDTFTPYSPVEEHGKIAEDSGGAVHAGSTANDGYAGSDRRCAENGDGPNQRGCANDRYGGDTAPPSATTAVNGRKAPDQPYPLSREEALQIIIGQTGPRDIIVSTTGKASREIFEYREETEDGDGAGDHSRDFLTVGSMGHSSQIALGIALAKPNRKVYCLDGDGALIMHMGGLAVIGELAPANYMHIVINNGAHESVGGQPTAGFKINIPAIARACGYKTAMQAVNGEELRRQLNALKEAEAPALLEVRVKTGARKNLGRPTTTPRENKEAFMQFLR